MGSNPASPTHERPQLKGLSPRPASLAVVARSGLRPAFSRGGWSRGAGFAGATAARRGGGTSGAVLGGRRNAKRTDP